MMHDVIIVGSGPVGCYTASLLARRGFDTVVLEKNLSVGHDVVCTGIIGMEAFERLGLPRDSVVNQIQDINFYSPSGICFCFRPDSPIALMVDRRRFDQGIAAMALDSGASLRCGSLVTDIAARGNGAVVEVEDSGKRFDLRAKLVVLACGFNPTLTERLGLGSPGVCLQGAEVELDMDGVGETEIYVGRDLAPGSFAWVAPMDGKRTKIGTATREKAVPFLRDFLNRPMIKNRRLSRNPQIRWDLIPIRPIRKSFRERVLVVGEAAGQVKSTTCGGIYYGLISAASAVETVEEAFSENRFDESVLTRYEARWRDALGHELEIGYRVRQVFSVLEDRQIDKFFGILNSDGIGAIIQNEARYDWHKDLILSLSKHMALRNYLHPIALLSKWFTRS
jgi:geranylgeranyl reductase family protein